MYSEENITWKIIDNSVTDRLINGSLIHKFRPSHRKIRRRTKVLNAELKKHYMMDYKHYVELKTEVLRNLTTDTDTSDSSSLTDVDYDIIYSSPAERAKYMAKVSKRYNFISEEDCEGCKRKSLEYQMKRRDSSTKKKIQTRKKSQTNITVSKKYIDVGWQEVKRNSNTPHLRKQEYTNILDNEGNILKDNNRNHFKAQCRKRSLLSQFDSQNSRTPSKRVKYENEYIEQNGEKSNTMNNKLSSENNTISNKTKSINKKKAENRKNQSLTVDESNNKFNSHDSDYQLSSSRTICLEDNFNDESIFIKSENNSSKKSTIINNESSINTKNCDNKCVSHKSELLKNVRRNLTSTLEKADSMNKKDIEIEKNVDDSNYDDLHMSAINFNSHSTPIKEIKTNIPKVNDDLSPNILLLDHQKDSGIDDDSQDKLVESKDSNKIAKNHNMKENSEKISIFSPELEKIDEIIETEEDCKKDEKEAHLTFSNNILRDQTNKEKKLSEKEEVKNSPQLNQIDVNVKINKEDKDEHSAKTEESNDIQKQQLLSPKQDCIKNTHSEPCNYIREEENDRKVKEFSEEEEEEVKNSPQLNQIDVNVEINQKDKDEYFVKTEESNDIQKQQLLSPKQDCMKDTHSEPCNYIREEENDRKIKESSKEEEVNNSPQFNQIDVNVEINQKDEYFAKTEESNDIQKQQLLSPKQNCMKDTYSEPCNYIEKENDRPVKEFSEEEEISRRLNNIDKDTELSSINRKDSIQSEDSCNIQKQQLLFPKKDHIEDIHLESHNILNEDKKQINEEKEEKNFSQLNEADKDAKTPLINQENKTVKLEDTHNVQKQQVLPKVMCSEILNKRYKIIDKKDSNVKNNIKTIDNNNTDITNEHTPIKRNTLIHCPDIIDNNIDNCQKAVINSEETDARIALETDNEEINVNYISPQTKKRLEQQARLNLVVSSDSNESDDEDITKTSEYRTQASAESHSNTHIISCQYKPCNLEELIEDQELLVETMPASFTLTDLSPDEEAFILNVPSKVIEDNLQGQVLTIKENSIKFNKNKYKIIHKEVGTTSFFLATGKKKRPYKLLNINKIGTITVREKLSQDPEKTNISSSVPSILNPIKINHQEIDEADSKMLKVLDHKKCKRRKSSDSGSPIMKKERLKSHL